jgi:predicted O-methyltransferase YrrM
MDCSVVLKDVEGFLFPEECELLRILAESFGDGSPIAIVEIGSYCGKSTLAFALGLKRRSDSTSRIFAIDWHQGSPEHQPGAVHASDAGPNTLARFTENIRRFDCSDVVIPVVSRSEDAVDKVPERIDILFLDGQHDFASVERDFRNYVTKVKAEGIVLFHDAYRAFEWPDVGRFIRQYVLPRHYLIIKTGTIVGFVLESGTNRLARTLFTILNFKPFVRFPGIGPIVRPLDEFFTKLLNSNQWTLSQRRQ